MRRITSVLAPAVLLIVLFTSSGNDILRTLAEAPQVSAPSALSFSGAVTWGEGYAKSNRIAVDGSGNVYVAGEFSGTADFDPAPTATDIHASANGTIDAFLSKFDPNGNFLWAVTWGGGSGRDVAYGVDVDNAGNAYVVGAYRYTVDFDPHPLLTDTHTSNYPGENNIYLSKFAPDGTFRWVRTWGPAPIPGRTSFGAEAYTVVVAGDCLYMVGDFSGDRTDFNPWGSHDWHQNHLTASGIVYFDAYLSKFDLDGNLQWAVTWGGEGYDDGPGVAVDGLGNVYVAGMYASQNINFDPAGGSGGLGHPAHDSGWTVDVFLTKFDATGNFQWVKTWGGQGTEDAMGNVVVDGANNVYVAGRFATLNCDFNPGGTPDMHSTNGKQDAFLSKFTADGTFRWAVTWGGSGDDQPMGVIADGAEDLYVSGWFTGTVDFDPHTGADNHASNGQHDAFLSRFDASGNFSGAVTWGGSGDDTAMGLQRDGAGHVYLGGGFVGTVDFDPGGGVENHTVTGQGAYLSRFLVLSNTVHLPLVTHRGISP